MLAVCCGWRGLYAVAVYVLLEILVWGVNLWALSYLYVWALLFVAARLLWRMESSLSWGLLSGFLAGVRRPVRRSLLAHRRLGGRGFLVDIRPPWDLVHGMGNFFMAFFLFKPLRRRLTQLCRDAGLGISGKEKS